MIFVVSPSGTVQKFFATIGGIQFDVSDIASTNLLKIYLLYVVGTPFTEKESNSQATPKLMQ